MPKKLKGGRIAREPAPTYVVKVVLERILPAIWRRLSLPADTPLAVLHDILQEAMGWTNSHLHLFAVGERQFSDPSFEWEEEMEDSARVRLNQVLKRKGSSIIYDYDMGDCWRHTITLEEILPATEARRRMAVCEAGARKAPPEDCGGTPGYESFLEAIRDPQHEEHDRMLVWIGGAFDPEEFNAEEINKVLKQIRP